VIQEFQAFFTLFQQGKSLANAATWKNRTVATNALVAVIGAGTLIAKGFGYDLHLDQQTVEALGAGVAAAVAVFNSVMHVISSDKVGLPAKPAALGGVGDGTTTGPGQTPNAGG
jgi:fructose-1-phosphate kinase PfkB-like protein